MPARAARTRSNRRTNWVGARGAETLTAGNVQNIILADPTDSTDEVSKYVDPTLIRIRGHILYDPDMASGATGSQFGQLWAAIYVSQIALTDFLVSGAVDRLSSWNADNILWTGAVGHSTHATQTTAVGWDRYSLDHLALTIDTKAKRRLQDYQIIRLALATSATSLGGFATYAIRMLIME